MLYQSSCNFAWLIEICESHLHTCNVKRSYLNRKLLTRRRAKLVKKDLSSVKNELMFKLKWIDFHYVCNLFLVGNDKSISKHQNIQDKKFCKLSNSVVGDVSHGPEQVIHNFSSHILTEAEKSVLCRGLLFALPPKTLENADYMVSFELLYQDIKTANLNTLQNETIKPKMLDTAVSLFDTFKKNKPQNNLSKIELQALNSLLQNKDIVTQKADKGNTIVVIDTDAYKKKMKAIISDRSKFEKLDIQEEKHLNFILNKEKRLRKIIKPLYEKGCFTKSEFLKICPTGSKPGILYRQAKVHKPVEDNCSSFHPILSAITPMYDLAKFLVPILKPLTEDKYTLHDSFSSASEVSKFNSKNLMATFDVECLFTNIPLGETIDNITNDLFLTTDKVDNFEREELKQLLTFEAYESFFIFDGEYYTQIDRVAMGSPLGPTLAAHSFLCHFEKKWLSECPVEFLPSVYKRYVDDIFVTFNSYSQLLKFVDYMNQQHPNIKFTF